MREISALIGPPRWYHLIVWLLTFVRAFPSSWTQMTALFIATDVEHWCSKPDIPFLANWTEHHWKERALPIVGNASAPTAIQKYDSCRMFPIDAVHVNGSDKMMCDRSRTVPCHSWMYNESVPGSSAVPEWNLVCQHEWQRSMMTSVVFVGSLVGSLLMGHLSDRFGRRTVFFSSVFGATLFGSLGAACSSVKSYIALRFFACINIAGIQTSSAALLAEILDPRYRTFLNLGYTAGFAIPTLLLPGVAYLIGSWKILQLVSGLVALSCVPFMLVVQESPRWLITTGREEQAKRAIAKILKINRRIVPNLHSVMDGLVARIRESSAVTIGPVEIMRHPGIRRNTFLLFVIWFCDNFLMFAVMIGAVHLEGNHFVNFAAATAPEIPAAFVGLAMVYFFRRRPSQVVSLALAGMAATAVELTPPGHPYVSLSLSMAGRFVLILSASVKWVWTMELFPTAARGFGFAACFTIGRIGGIVAPFMSDLKKEVPVFVVPGLLLAAGMVGAAAATLLPETRGIELPDTFDEAEDVAKGQARPVDLSRNTLDKYKYLEPGHEAQAHGLLDKYLDKYKFCDNFLMFAVMIGAVHFEGNHFVNFAASTAPEIPTAFVGLAMVYFFRRRPSQVVSLALAGMAATAVELTPPVAAFPCWSQWLLPMLEPLVTRQLTFFQKKPDSIRV